MFGSKEDNWVSQFCFCIRLRDTLLWLKYMRKSGLIDMLNKRGVL